MRGFFITMEGTDGSGKSTQMCLMEGYLRGKGFSVVLTREPGGTSIGEKIRSILLDTANSCMDSTAELLLYSAARAQLVSEVIKPAVDAGNIVICDRFVDSTFVYQGFARALGISAVEEVNKIVLKGLMPDLTLFFDISPVISLNRRVAATGADRMEQEKMEFHMAVYNGYKQLACLYSDRIKAINSNRDVGEIFEDVKLQLNRLIE